MGGLTVSIFHKKAYKILDNVSPKSRADDESLMMILFKLNPPEKIRPLFSIRDRETMAPGSFITAQI